MVVVLPTEPREQTADQQVEQVLNRLGFGARPGDVARVRAMGVDQWIGLQLAPDRIADDAANRLSASYETAASGPGDLVRASERAQELQRMLQVDTNTPSDSTTRRDRRAALLRDDPALRDQIRLAQRAMGDAQSARLARAVVSDRQLQEVMTDFWENHFSVYGGKGITRLLVPAYDRDVIRPHALGRFRDLLGAVAQSPAMLFYLDQWQSAADSTHSTLGERGGRRSARARQPARRGLNENYARELLELHTLGVDGGYSQQDVIDVARALTGWTLVSRVHPDFTFRAQVHDADVKRVLGHTLPGGRGIDDGAAVLDILARDPHTAHFIARKLVVRFVSDTPSSALVERAAATFMRTDGDIREVVRTIVTSTEFFSRAAYRVKVKSPFELVASALRAVGAEGDTTLRSAQMVGALGQPIFGHQAPDGWPETGDAWINAGSILARINFGMALAADRLPGASLDHWTEASRLRDAARATQVDAVVTAFLGGHASPDTREILMKGDNPLAARSVAPTAGAMPPSRPVPLTGLAQVVGLAIGAPEFQRR